jgi:hypothetical protein
VRTTPYGYRVPQTGDAAKGIGGWYESVEFDVDRLDNHNHDGTNSRLLSSTAIPTATVDVLAANWLPDGPSYKQTVTMPASVPEVDNVSVRFKQTAPVGPAGMNAMLSFKRLTATTVEIYCSDNTASFLMIMR